MPAQDTSIADPHAQLLSMQAKIAAQTGGQTPNVTASPTASPPTAQPTQKPEKPKEEKPRLEGFDPKDKNLLEKPKPSFAPPAGGATKGQVNLNHGNQGDVGDKGVIGEDTGSTKGSSAGMVNPNAMLELMKADIFKLLGMGQITEVEKKKNLDEMEETIWQDFVEADLPEMLPADQKVRFEELLKTAPSAEKIINFFGNPPAGGLPKDFEQKYLRKTLDFKAEIVKEQIETLTLANEGKDQKKIELLKAAKAAADTGHWKQVEDLMKQYSS